jgi:uncharacterized membrane protein HdeD (DUF308 family)
MFLIAGSPAFRSNLGWLHLRRNRKRIPFRRCRFDRRDAAAFSTRADGLEHAADSRQMLEALARNWNWLLFRAIIAALYGVVSFVWPNMTLVAFVSAFGVYSIVDGVTALAISIDVKALPGFGGLVFEALVRITGGLLALGSLGVIETFPRFLAGWMLLSGVGEVVIALVLRRELAGEWPLPFAGAVSMVIAAWLLVTPIAVGVPALRWLMGPYAIIFAATLLALARRLRRLAQEIEAA